MSKKDDMNVSRENAQAERQPCAEGQQEAAAAPAAVRHGPPLRAVTYIHSFLKHDSTSGILLIIAALAAMVAANHPALSAWYDHFLHTKGVVKLGEFDIEKGLLHWINDGLMAIFFLLVGLELKREFLGGELSSRDRIIMPALAALGGMVLPAVVYIAINYNDPLNLKGWAIPAATDIAFALGILALLGKRVPLALKTFLLALAMFDDLGAIVIIALFYTQNLDLHELAIAGVALLVLIFMNRVLYIRAIGPYLIVGAFMWSAVLESGVHATLAGFVLALCIPYVTAKERGYDDVHYVKENPALVLEHMLHPYVALLIMPLFAFANAGVKLEGPILELLTHPVTLGIALGLFIGKQLGVLGAVLLGQKLGLLRIPSEMRIAHLYGVALLAGIGFTMSLFIGTLSFADPEHASAVRVGVLLGSLMSAVAGYLVLTLTLPRNSATPAAVKQGA